MSDKTSSSSTSRVSVVLWFVVGVLCLGEFVRVELILNEHRTRLDKIEEKTNRKDVVPSDVKTKEMKAGQTTIDPSQIIDVSRQRARRNTVSLPLNNSNIQAVRQELLQTMGVELNKAFTKVCGAKNIGCPPGPPGPPGRPGRKGSTGRRGPPGRRGKRGHQGSMGMPGRSGKQGMMGPVGLKGEKGDRGDRGLPGVAGRDGRPGQSISAPDITVSPPLLIVNESETAVLHCAGRGNPRPVIGWTRVGGLLDKKNTVLDGRAGVAWNHNLQIRNVSSNDSGVYECKGSNILGQAHQTATLVVNYRPRVSLSYGPHYAAHGGNFTFPRCHVTGHPAPSVTWSKVFGNLPDGRTLIKKRQLTLSSLEIKDSGLYVCKGSNTLGSSFGQIQINIIKLPKFTTTPPPSVLVAVGDSLRLDCQATANPPPLISWTNNNQEVSSDDRIKLHINGSLTITRLKTTDSGYYVCKAVSAGVFNVRTETKVTVSKEQFDLKFTRRSTTDYVIIKGIPTMTAVTFCYWMRTTDTQNEGTLVSYAANGMNNQFTLLDYRNIYLYIKDVSKSTGVSANDGQWHHICATWGKTAGSWALYKDGAVAAQGSGLSKNHVIPGGGTLILGQEQDIEGGDFDSNQAFIGEFTGLNIWNRVLGPSEISQMSRDCLSGEGNVLRWRDVIGASFRGQVKKVPSSCIRR